MATNKADIFLRISIGVLLAVLAGVIVGSLRETVVLVGDTAPDFEITTDAGKRITRANFGGRLLVLNFWATWCPPCVEELPLLSRFYRENAAKGWQVLALAVDQQDAVQRFLAQAPVSCPVVLAGTAGIELYRSLGNLSGGLPFTVVLGSDGRVAHRKMGKISADDLQAWTRLK